MDDTVNRPQAGPEKSGDIRPSSSPARPKPRRKALLFVVALALVGVAYIAYRDLQSSSSSSKQGGLRLPPQAVRTAVATLGDMPITLDALGTVTSLDTVNVLTQVTGRVVSVGFKEGQIVKAGDHLAQIDPRPFQAALEQAQASLAKDKALLAQAQADLARYQQLLAQDSISKQQAQDQKFLTQQDEAAVAVDQANVDTASLNLSFAAIDAPISGLAGLQQVGVGNYLQPSSTTPIVTIAQLEPISVIFAVPQQSLPQILARLKAGAQLQALALDQTDAHTIATGQVLAVDSQINTTTGTVNIKALFPNADDVLFPNQFVNVKLSIDSVKGALLVPSQAVQQGAPGAFVYLVQPDGVVKVQPVKTGASDAVNTVVTTGLSAGQQVVIDGADRLSDGAHVIVRNAESTTGSAGGAAQNRSGSGPAGGGGRRARPGDAAPAPGAPANGPSP